MAILGRAAKNSLRGTQPNENPAFYNFIHFIIQNINMDPIVLGSLQEDFR
jgi:hypothetical protein